METKISTGRSCSWGEYSWWLCTKNERDFDGGKDGRNNFGRSLTYDGSFIVGGPDDDLIETVGTMQLADLCGGSWASGCCGGVPRTRWHHTLKHNPPPLHPGKPWYYGTTLLSVSMLAMQCIAMKRSFRQTNALSCSGMQLGDML